MQDSKKVEALEATILELGSDLSRMKNSMSELRQTVKTALKIIDGVRVLLDEKDLLSEDELDEKIQFLKDESISVESESSISYVSDPRKILAN